jgi:hypothetical protein
MAEQNILFWDNLIQLFAIQNVPLTVEGSSTEGNLDRELDQLREITQSANPGRGWLGETLEKIGSVKAG